MSPLTKAMGILKDLHPDYFQRGRGRIPMLSYRMGRPDLLSESWFEGLSLREIATPPGMCGIPVAIWKDWFDEIVAENLSDTDDQLRYLADDLTLRCCLNTRQRTRFFPNRSKKTRQVINTILAFCLQGAITAGARISELTDDTFTLAADNGEWGIRRQRICHTDFKLHFPLNYAAVVSGKAWQGGSCRNSHLAKAHYAAHQARDLIAKELLTSLFWNIPEGRRIDSLCTR